MSIAKTLFGQTPDGQPIYLYTLTNSHGISASFTDLGGTWVSMMVPDRDGRWLTWYWAMTRWRNTW